jgi:hypothetical protein
MNIKTFKVEYKNPITDQYLVATNKRSTFYRIAIEEWMTVLIISLDTFNLIISLKMS